MSTQLGRISGALLKDNLLRDGIDLGLPASKEAPTAYL